MGLFGRGWEGRVRPHFDFLLEHGFRFAGVDFGWWKTSALYLSPTLGVEIDESIEFDRVELTLVRLVNGEVPEYDVFITERPLNRALFDNVLVARAPHLLDRVSDGLRKRQVEQQLRTWSELLRTVAHDFVAGSDAAIADAEGVVRENVKRHPQEVTVWLRSDATDEEEARARTEAERTTPPEVDVVIRRYAR